MLTKEQAMETARTGRWLHYTGRHECTRTIGPRGGVTDHVTEVRPSGACKTWKTRPEHFRLPVKYGLYEHSAVTHENAADFHLAEDCPLAVTLYDGDK